MMRREFIPAGEQPRRYSEVRAERLANDPAERLRARTLDEIARLEGEASEATDALERKRLLCEAEELRCQLDKR